MKTQKLDVAQVWKEFEDHLAPRLNFSVYDRAVYSFLIRHTYLEDKPKLQFSLGWMGHFLGMSKTGARNSLRRLVAKGVVRLVLRSAQAHHVISVNLPSEVRAIKAAKSAAARSALGAGPRIDIEKADFMRFQVLRRSIHEREGGKCFYCLRRTIRQTSCLDHVIPQANLGGNSYRNLVSCCHDCNSKKKVRRADDFLRWLFRERRLSAAELSGRLRALKAGKLIPRVVPLKQSRFRS
jgi:hypothetical protein